MQYYFKVNKGFSLNTYLINNSFTTKHKTQWNLNYDEFE